MGVDDLEKGTVRLVPASLKMREQRKGIPIYTITNWTFDHIKASNPNAGLVVKIHLKRKIQSELMTTFFPTTLLVLITAATTHSWKKLELVKRTSSKTFSGAFLCSKLNKKVLNQISLFLLKTKVDVTYK